MSTKGKKKGTNNEKQKPVSNYFLRNQPMPGEADSVNSGQSGINMAETDKPDKPDTGKDPALTMEAIEILFQRLDDKLSKQIEDVKVELIGVKTKIDDIGKKVNDHEKALEFQGQAIEEIKTKLIPTTREELLAKIQALEDKLLLKDIHDRKRNLRIYGIPVTSGTVWTENTNSVVRKFLTVDLRLPGETVENMIFVSCHRLPSRLPYLQQDDGPPPPPPIIFTVLTDDEKDLIMASTHNLKKTKISIRTGLPPELRAARGKLASKGRELRESTNCQTRIRVQRTEVVLEMRSKPSDNLIKYTGL